MKISNLQKEIQSLKISNEVGVMPPPLIQKLIQCVFHDSTMKLFYFKIIAVKLLKYDNTMKLFILKYSL